MATTSNQADMAGWQPKAIVFDLLTAMMDSWTLWDASTPSGTAAEGRLWRGRYLEITFGAGSYVPYEDLVRESARQVGLPESAPNALLDGWEKLQPWPEVAGVLRELRTKGYKLGVVTNCSKRLGHVAAENTARMVEGFNFDAVVTAEESGYYKPDKRAYGAALEAMGVDAGEVLFVAGSAGDVEGATEAGMRVVWHNKAGLSKKGEAIPLRESDTLDGALRGFL